MSNSFPLVTPARTLASAVITLSLILAVSASRLEAREVRHAFETLCECDSDDNGSDDVVDIVAVHGLGSDSKHGWSSKDGVCWLSEFLHQDLEKERLGHRILLFNHDSRWGARSSEMSFEAFAEDLLDALVAARQTPNKRKRRIVFIGHSFGGLLIKKALVKAALKSLGSADSPYTNIYKSTAGVVFLGVPHAGCNEPFLFAARLMSFLNWPFGSRSDLLETAGCGHGSMYYLNRDFVETYPNLDAVCFYETHAQYIWGIRIGPVVSEESASIAGYAAKPLPADHRNINKFPTRGANYLKVWYHLKHLIAPRPPTPANPESPPTPVDKTTSPPNDRLYQQLDILLRRSTSQPPAIQELRSLSFLQSAQQELRSHVLVDIEKLKDVKFLERYYQLDEYIEELHGLQTAQRKQSFQSLELYTPPQSPPQLPANSLSLEEPTLLPLNEEGCAFPDYVAGPPSP